MPIDLDQKLGPLSRKAWIGVAGATVAVWYLWRRHEASTAAGTATALSGGDTIPGDSSTDGSVTSTANTFSTIGAWETAAIAAMTSPGYSDAQALNDLTSWLGGQCVTSAGYNAISSIIGNASVGLPPGYNSLPSLSVCPQAAAPTPPAAPVAAPTAPAVPAPNPIVGDFDSDLAMLNWESFAQKVTSGFQLQGAGATTGGPDSYTQVGTWQGTQGYSGQKVLNGAPVYAYVNGILQQGNMGLVPVGSPIYVPTSLVAQGYVIGDGPTPANA
jgi:hypothetical protein